MEETSKVPSGELLKKSKKSKKKATKLSPQEGPQTAFLKSSADIVIYGGGAGGGKTFALLLESLRHRFNPTFKAVIFRKTIQDVIGEGGIWSDTESIFPGLGAVANSVKHRWTFPNPQKLKSKIKKLRLKEMKRPRGATISFAGLQHEKDKYKFQGRQIPLICFDELTHFSKTQFFYMLSRNRLGTGAYGVRPYIRATCNPDPDSWVKPFIAWWLDEKTGYAIPERSGVIRWFIRDGNKIVWFDSEAAAKELFPKKTAMSFTFILSSIFDNPALLAKDPDYLSKLEAMPHVEKMQLLGGNWNIRALAGDYYKRENIPKITKLPEDIVCITRYWDRASTEVTETNTDPDYTSGTLFGRTARNTYFWAHQLRIRMRPGKVLALIKSTTKRDMEEFGSKFFLSLEQDPGSAGVAEIDYLCKELAGFPIKIFKPSKGQDKVTRQKPLSSQVERGNVEMLVGSWNDDLLDELEGFPEAPHDDQVDTSGGAFNAVALNQIGDVKQVTASAPVTNYKNKYRK